MATKSILGDRFNDACKGLNDCKSLQRLQETLQYYQSTIKDNDEEKTGELLMEYLKTNKYKNMMNDYHHLLLKHLNAEDNTINAQNYQIINDSTIKLIECQLSECKCYKIYNRDKEKQSETDSESVNDDNKEQQEDDKQIKQRLTAQVYVELLNNIHMLLIHGYDIGYRVKSIIDNDENTIDDDNEYFDKEVLSLAATLKEKRQDIIKNIGIKRFEQNRFVTSPNKSNKDEEEKVDNNNNNNIIDDMMMDCIDYGHRFYYWNWYKQKKDNDPDNNGYKYMEMYVEQKYNNLKDEIIDKLDIKQFDYASVKAQKFLKFALLFKKLKSRDTLTCGLRYDIAKRKPMTYNHLLSIILYTDYRNLSHLFRLSFQRQSMDETLDDFKKRNSEFWNFAKLLRETVEVFGDRLGDKPKISQLYHSTSFVYINCAIARIYAPISMTRQFSTAILLSPENGIVLDVVNYGYDKPYYFNTTLLGFGGLQDERLMFGGKQLTQFKTMRIINISENYSILIQVLQVLSIIIRGESISMQDKDIFAKNMENYATIIQQLIDKKISGQDNKLKDYFNGSFQAFTNNQRIIKIDIKKLARDFDIFKKIFICDQTQNLLSFDFVCKIFTNCHEISSDLGSGGGDFDTQSFDKLSQILININNDNNIKKLKCIRIIKCKYNDEDLTVFIANNNENWKIDKAGSTKLIITRKE